MVDHPGHNEVKHHSIDSQKISEIQPDVVFEYLKTAEDGLSTKESQDRMLIYGENTIKTEKSFHPVWNFIKQLVNIMAVMLWIASILALISGTPLLSYVIWFIIIVNAVFSFVQENKADKALQSLAKMIPNNVKVYRDGQMTVLSAAQLVPGDVIFLKAGDKVPADLRIVSADSLFVDNSMLTGESVPVDRDAEAESSKGQLNVNSRNLLFAGTTITGGTAKGVVYATGKDTEIGNLSQTTAHIVRRKSTLEVQIQKITKTMVIIAIILGIVALCISVFVTGFEVNAALIFSIGIIVANVPEGLMPIVSFSLAKGVQRMASKNALIRKQMAVETLSTTSVICTDKTGTLTQNVIFAQKIWTPDGLVEISGEGYGKQGMMTGITEKNKPTLERLFSAAIICSDTMITDDKEMKDKWKIIGNPTEASILIAAQKFGMTVEQVKGQFERTAVVPFSSNTKSMTVIARNMHASLFNVNQMFQFTKGDPAKVMDHCSFIFKDGQVIPFTTEEKERAHAVNDEMASQGYRLLAIAYSDDATESEAKFENLTLLGLVVMYDPPKSGVREAVADCYKAGIKVTVVTGDYSLTAAAIARQIGIVKDQYIAITGAELEKMSNEELAKRIDTDIPVIFARTTPKDKLKIVETYQSLGHVVAVTGDGLNDVLALHKADIGISMGKNGSDAAIESSDVILLDDNFATIVDAIKEGRAIYDNIQKFITYILASNVPEVMPFLVMGIFNIPLALTVLLVLVIDLGTDLVLAISLGEELPDDDVLDYPPRNPNENILNKKVLLRSYGFLGVIEAAMMFAMFFLAWHDFGYSLSDMQSITGAIANGTASEQVMSAYHYTITIALGAVIASQIGNVIECRTSRLPFNQMMKKKNRLMAWGILSVIVLFFLIAYVPFMQLLFETSAPKPHHLALLLLCPVVLILLEELRKWFVRRMKQRVKIV